MLVMWLVEWQLSLASVGDVKEGAGEGEGEGMKREYHIWEEKEKEQYTGTYTYWCHIGYDKI